MGGLRGGASAQGPGGPADAPGLNVRRDVQGRRRRRRAAERGVAGRAAERGQRRRWRLTGGAGEGERGVRSDGRKFRVGTGGRVHFASVKKTRRGRQKHRGNIVFAGKEFRRGRVQPKIF